MWGSGSRFQHRIIALVASTSVGVQCKGFSRKKTCPEFHGEANAGAYPPLHTCDSARYCSYVSAPMWVV